jgi:hypothetical protein
MCPSAPSMALNVNGPIPISLYLCFLSRIVVGSIEDLPRYVFLDALPDPSGRLETNSAMEIRSVQGDLQFSSGLCGWCAYC